MQLSRVRPAVLPSTLNAAERFALLRPREWQGGVGDEFLCGEAGVVGLQ